MSFLLPELLGGTRLYRFYHDGSVRSHHEAEELDENKLMRNAEELFDIIDENRDQTLEYNEVKRAVEKAARVADEDKKAAAAAAKAAKVAKKAATARLAAVRARRQPQPNAVRPLSQP